VSVLNGQERFPDLRLISLGGDTVHRKDVEEYKRFFSPSCVLSVRYSSTEVSPICLSFLDHASELPDGNAPVGYPVDGVEVLLLDDRGEPVGLGDTGEIVVRSRYLADGYWRRPDLTAAAFVAGPSGAGARMYRTGDLGRMRADGRLEHLGRKDSRIVIRGVGVAGAEVEAVLLAYPGIDRVAVAASIDRYGETVLVAYVVPSGDRPPTTELLRAHLRARLPGSMIPTAFVFLDALPLTSNGKIERHALPPPGWTRPSLDVPFLAPRTLVEQQIAEIWADVLSLDVVGVNDDFLALGGDSLRATRVVARLRDRFDLNLPIGMLLKTNTVARIAEVIVQDRTDQAPRDHLVALLSEVEGLTEAQVASRLVENPT
jgi:acyl carrier protein